MRTISFPKANDAKDKEHFHAAHKTFSLTTRLKSFGYAWSGIIRFFKTEANARLHLVATAGVILASLQWPPSRLEVLVIVLCIALVWITEMINTAIEKIMDSISLDRHPRIKLIKDVAAGAVLVASVSAAIIGGLIFLPKIF